MKKLPKDKIVISEDFPLRGVLKCHCAKPLTGAPSRGRAGNYYNYYKCPVAGYNNINANKAHQQLEEALNWMSLPDQMIKDIKEESSNLLEKRLIEN
jgi:site-specific DNA recombinase